MPIIAYLLECPKPEAAEYIKELKKIDPQAFERASFYRNIGDVDDDDWGDSEDEDAQTVKDVSPANSDENAEDKPAADVDSESSDSEPAADKPAEMKDAPAETHVIRDANVRSASAEFRAEDASGVEPERAGDTPAKSLAEHNANNSASIKEQTVSAAKASVNRSVQVAAAASSLRASQRDPAQSSASWILTLKVIFIPLAASFLILGLMWSVVNGWFERLIF